MCKHGTTAEVIVINKTQSRRNVQVDACISDEIQWLNGLGITTLGCCCGHGKAGEIYEIENGHGVWKGNYDPPNVLIAEGRSVQKARELGYRPFPYYYADGESNGVWQMYLKTGCVTYADVEAWHAEEESQ
jgi:hypothetical protein